MSESESEVLRLHRRLGELEVKKDLNGWLKMVDDDIVLQPPGAPEVRGKEAAERFLMELFALPIRQMDVGDAVVVVSESDDMALIHGEIAFALDDPEQGEIEQQLKCMAVWVRVDGDWIMRANSWSSNS